MTKDQRTLAIEKALLLVALGFIEALQHGAIHEDEAYYTVGIPQILARMKGYGISPEVTNAVSELDEYGALSRICSEQAWQSAMQSDAGRCLLSSRFKL